MIRAELLGPDGEVLTRVRLPAAMTIGSDRSCGLALADSAVAPTHLEVVAAEGGMLRLRHVGGDAPTRVGALVLAGEAEVAAPALVVLGDVTVRLSLEAPAPAIAEPTSGEPHDRARRTPAGALGPDAPPPLRAPAAWLLLGAAAALIGTQEYFTTYDATPWREGITMTLGLVAAVLVWAGGWALGNRIFGHRASFSTHLGVASGWILVATPLWLVAAAMDQSLHAGVTASLETAVGFATAIALLWAHVRVASRWRRSVNVGIAAGVVLGLSSLALLADDSDAPTQVRASLSSIAPLPAAFFTTRPADTVDDVAADLLAELEDLEAKRSVEPR